jgi:hypothetical protein
VAMPRKLLPLTEAVVTYTNFYHLPDHERFFGSFYQLADYDRRHKQLFFDNEGNFNTSSWPLHKFMEFQASLLRESVFVPFFKNFPKFLEVFKDREFLFQILNVLHREPRTFSPLGRLVFWLRTELPDNANLIQSKKEIRNVSLKDYCQNQLSPANLKFLGAGGYNIVYKLNLPDELSVSPTVIRINKKHPKDFNSYQEQAELQNKLRDLHQAEGLAKVPKVYFVGGNNNYMALQYIPFARQLVDILPILDFSEQKKIKTILSNTLDFWRNGLPETEMFLHRDLHGGNVVVTLNLDNTLRDVYIIDLDFSAFLPKDIENPLVSYLNGYAQTLHGTIFSYEPDSQIARYFQK